MNPNPGYPQPPAPQPQKKGLSGCAIALIIVGGLVGLLVIGSIVATMVFLRSDTGRKVVDVVGKGTQAVTKGMTAPGTAEMRTAGCPQAMVLDLKDFIDMFSTFVDGGIPKKDEDATDYLMVICQGQFGTKLPSCDEVAKAYIGAVNIADKPFVVMVQRQGNNKPLCQVKYSMTRENQGPFTGKTTGNE